MTDDTPPLELVYKGSCPYCQAVASAVEAVDVLGKVQTTEIESERGRRLVEKHHGEYVLSPHLFTDELVYYGVTPTAKGLLKEYIRPA